VSHRTVASMSLSLSVSLSLSLSSLHYKGLLFVSVHSTVQPHISYLDLISAVVSVLYLCATFENKNNSKHDAVVTCGIACD